MKREICHFRYAIADHQQWVGMLNGPDTISRVPTIISLAHWVRLEVMVEGVDFEEQAKVMQRLCCDETQGDLFSHPLPLDAKTALIRRQQR